MREPIKLSYNYDYFEPYIDSKTMDIHYNKYYLNYLNNVNKLTNNNLINVLKNIDDVPIENREYLKHNIGGVLNHELYFDSLGYNNYPSKEFLDIIIKDFGSFENFKNELIKKANSLVGSGYLFVVINDGKLDIITLSNQDNPYSYGMIPIIAIDLWEHAYFLNYLNKKDLYVNNIFEIIDFNKAFKRYEENKPSKQKI